jgi:hypothetical protein
MNTTDSKHMNNSWEQGAGRREQGAGSREQGAGSEGAGSKGAGSDVSRGEGVRRSQNVWNRSRGRGSMETTECMEWEQGAGSQRVRKLGNLG